MSDQKLSPAVNPLEAIRRGESVPNIPRPKKKFAKIGNLFHEYVRGQSFEQKGVNSSHVADSLSKMGLITVDNVAGTYIWKGTPMTNAEFNETFGARQAKLAAVQG